MDREIWISKSLGNNRVYILYKSATWCDHHQCIHHLAEVGLGERDFHVPWDFTIRFEAENLS
jgi:hypothetical protein